MVRRGRRVYRSVQGDRISRRATVASGATTERPSVARNPLIIRCTMAISRRSASAIWGRAGGRCYLNPSEELTRTSVGDLPIGEIAHIVARQPGGPRSDKGRSDVDIDHPDNLILLCPSHHREVDGHPDIWTVERLRQIKAHHEDWIQRQLEGLASWDPDTYRRDSNGPQVVVGFEDAEIAANGSPRYAFAARNAGPDTVVVHSVQADILALDVRPSVLAFERWTAAMMLRQRTPVAFDLGGGGHAQTVGPWHLDAVNNFEVAIDLARGESHVFVASLDTGDFCAGMFRLVIRYWDWPDHQFAATTHAIGMFEVPDQDDLPRTSAPATGRAIVLDVEALARIGDPDEKKPGARSLLAERALGRIGSPDARDSVERWLSEPARSMAALTAIGAAWDRSWRSMMIERALSSESPDIRVHAVELIDTPHESPVYEALGLRALSDPHPDVREAAMSQLRMGYSPRLDGRLSES